MKSQMVDGFALNNTWTAQGMPKVFKNAKIAFLDFNLHKHRLQMGVRIDKWRRTGGLRLQNLDFHPYLVPYSPL